MKKIAVLLTCFNRKEKTISSLYSLYNAYATVSKSIELDVFLTDDGSTDGTSEAVKEKFPKTTILKGNGNLYWNGGMRHTWTAALDKGYDYFLLLNDDTTLYDNALKKLLEAQVYCVDKYGQQGIYIGSTQDPNTKKFTYGGSLLTHKFKFSYHALPPNGTYQKCDLGNANIMFVPKEVVTQIGILSDGYRHGIGDTDYTLKAVKKNIPCLVLPDYLGHCENEHKEVYEGFSEKTLIERWKYLNHPLGLAFKSTVLFMWRHFPTRVPFVVIAGIYKVFFPGLYIKSLRNNR
ncbi:glycosyltransferase family 2 protein [Maribacter hydrothermalis]|uniref:Glycosyltransferase 2-like domain-containing protein n=1 Tax=Maribacter hydrothermalis TaxID=1836467 RepID=A0A1B7ZDA0_9FLAO|nr:glycosyltransferase [Maribacter hydrothermalis]APQ18508.1 hypothetical protein BTR34_14805 [Maribacter hydrothermalis]OBR41285.1 hypothetical protein A9200_13290 [Maribacter hydrothermalis]